MVSGSKVELATLDDGRSRLEIGWKPRDARGRLSAYARGSPEEWIKVRGCVRCAEGAWEFTDQCLTEPEAVQLAEHLNARPWTDGPWLEFLEPCLAVRAAGAAGRHLVTEWRFRGEIAPPWIRGDPEAIWEEGFVLSIAPDGAGLQRFAAELRRMVGLV